MDALTNIKKRVRNYLLAALGALVLTCATNAQAGAYAFPIGADGPGFGPDGGVFFENYVFGCGESGLDFCEEGGLVTYGKLINEVDYVDLIFIVEGDLPNGAPNGFINEVLVDEYVLNGTGVDWTDYHLELGYADINFFDEGCDVEVLECFDYEFFAPDPNDQSLYFTNVAETNDPEYFAENSFVPEDHPNMVWFDDGVYPYASSDPFELFSDFAIPNAYSTDIPDAARLEECDGQCYGVVLRQYPTIAAVPAPAAIWLFGIGLLGLGFARRRKHN